MTKRHPSETIKTIRHQWHRNASAVAIVTSLVFLGACNGGAPPKPFNAEVAPTEPIAKIQEIRDRPVWVKFRNTANDSSGRVGMKLEAGEIIRTEADARLQLSFDNGILVRLEGDSTIEIKNENQVVLKQGRMVVMLPADQDTALEIDTPQAQIFASDSNTTLFVETATEESKSATVFALNGAVKVKPQHDDRLTLETGQSVLISEQGNAGAIETPSLDLVREKFAREPLLYGFSTRLASQGTIEASLQIDPGYREAEKIVFTGPKPNSTVDPNAKPPETTAYSSYSAEPEPAADEPEAEPDEDAQSEPNQPTAAIDPAPAESDDGYDPPLPAAADQDPDIVPLPAVPAAVQPQLPVAEPPPAPIQPEIVPIEPPPAPIQPEIVPISDPPPAPVAEPVEAAE
ncbi:FecR family protein [Thalassoporum mexicanum PCC 7367]|uniref:FecR family protein n=1 Tax=Thalassoporum mexicanum TaxID=3457544 RepID=UPI00029FE154|nr:FecR family protein [Pseudanabaena sp. PCC 7367]AFY69506.1 FecR family protein [Pseudanabaena sp. PCC 7367]